MVQVRLERPNSGISDIGSANGALYFWPGGYDSPTGNVLIPTSGNVGIGTYTPERTLHITKDNMVQLRLERPNSGITDIGSADNSLYFWPGGYDNKNGNVIFNTTGRIGIGTTSPDYKLDVLGTIRAQEIKVDLNGADFVFEDDYNLRSLEEVKNDVMQNKHLPDIESATEMEANGTDLGELNTKLLQKIKELTLYMIEMNEQVKLIKQENSKLKDIIKEMESVQ